MKISIVGSGYVGLVAGACLAEIGHDVICVDNDKEKISALQAGETVIHEEFLPELLRWRFPISQIVYCSTLLKI